jgi:hypothetical protein
MIFFSKLEELILKLLKKHKRHQTAKATLSKKSNGGGIIIHDIKLCYKVIVIKSSWY